MDADIVAAQISERLKVRYERFMDRMLADFTNQVKAADKYEPVCRLKYVDYADIPVSHVEFQKLAEEFVEAQNRPGYKHEYVPNYKTGVMDVNMKKKPI